MERARRSARVAAPGGASVAERPRAGVQGQSPWLSERTLLKIRVFTLAFDSERGGFDDGAIQRFMEDVEVLEVAHQFFVHERAPWLMLLLSYRLPGQEPSRAPKRRADVREELDGAERARFEALRHWRANRARVEGVPVYVVSVNKVLAEIARRCPASMAELSRIAGVGEGRLGKYGDDILNVIRTERQSADVGKGTSDEPT